MSENLRARIISTLHKILGPDVDLENTRLAMSSLKMLEVIVALETEFGVEISVDEPIAQITSSVHSIVEHLGRLLEKS
jgi:acyl carrier protein